MNFLLKQQMQDKYQASHSQQRLGKAGPLPPGGEGVRNSFLCCSPGSTSEVALPMPSFPPSFALEVRGRVHLDFLTSTSQPLPSFPKVVRNSRRNHCPCSRCILREVTRYQSKVLASAVLCSPDVLPILPHWTSLHSHGTSQGSQWPSEHEVEPKSDIPAVPGSTGASSSLNAPCGDASLLEG